MIELLNCDCMEHMKGLENNAFDLAIVDPPYGISATKMNMSSDYRDGKYYPKEKNRSTRNELRVGAEWDAAPPGPEYFAELRRVSVNQIIWGGNYFDLSPTRCVVCWDKQQPWENFSQWEMAWTSFNKPAAIFRRGNSLQEPGKIHPTQKPVKLYQFLLGRYAIEGDRILDTHLGSGSSAIAAHYGGFDFVGMEIDKDYFDAAVKRFNAETSQMAMEL